MPACRGTGQQGQPCSEPSPALNPALLSLLGELGGWEVTQVDTRPTPGAERAGSGAVPPLSSTPPCPDPALGELRFVLTSRPKGKSWERAAQGVPRAPQVCSLLTAALEHRPWRGQRPPCPRCTRLEMGSCLPPEQTPPRGQPGWVPRAKLALLRTALPPEQGAEPWPHPRGCPRCCCSSSSSLHPSRRSGPPAAPGGVPVAVPYLLPEVRYDLLRFGDGALIPRLQRRQAP